MYLNTLIFIRWRIKKSAYKIFYTPNFKRLNAFSVFFSHTCAYLKLQHALVFNMSYLEYAN